MPLGQREPRGIARNTARRKKAQIIAAVGAKRGSLPRPGTPKPVTDPFAVPFTGAPSYSLGGTPYSAGAGSLCASFPDSQWCQPLNPGTGQPGGGPLPPPPSGGGGGGGGGTGVATDPLCDLIPDPTVRALCYTAGGVFFGGGGGGGNGGGGGVAPTQPRGCPEGYIEVAGQCVRPQAVPPGGDPFTIPAGGNAVQGAFGMPAMTPAQTQRVHRSCPEGMVLGKDNLCYPRQVLPRNSRFRKWRSSKPKISAGEWKTLKRAERTAEKAKKVAKTAGYKVTNR